MGLLDQLLGSVLKSGSSSDMLGGVMQLINNEGGFESLLSKFTGSGQGDKVDSWVGKSENASLSPDEVRAALGDESIARVAKNLGVSEEAAAQDLAKTLPEVVNEATPDGRIPSESEVEANLTKALGG
jgi:uncharacterized protein YidB (DUF937 family)